MQAYEKVAYSPSATAQKVRQLRTSWLYFMKDPSEYVNALLQISTSKQDLNVFYRVMRQIFMFVQEVTTWNATRN